AYSVYVTGGIILVILVLPGLFLSFKASNHQQVIEGLTQAVGDQGFANSLANALIEDRTSMARADALRSLIFVLIGAGLIWALIKKTIKQEYLYAIFAIVILVDMWGVDRRYLNNEKFVEK